MKPTNPTDRLLEIDVLRGLAVVGMVFWNFRSRSMGNFHVAGTADHVVDWLVGVSDIEDTIHLLFAFLFGWGLAQAMRKDASGWAVAATDLRRLATLFLMGMATACLFDRTDVLRYLAVWGAVLLLFLRLPDRTVLAMAVVMVAAPVLVGRFLNNVLPSGAYEGSHLWTSLEGSFIQSASYSDMVATRAREALQGLSHPKEYIESLDMLAAFLLALYAARRGVFRDIAGHLGLIRKTLVIALVARVLGLAWTSAVAPGWGARLPHALTLVVEEYSKQALTLGYICLVVLLLRGGVWRAVLRPLAAVGRLALSNYLFQSALGTTIFFGYGLGLYGKFGMAAGESLAVVTVFMMAMGSGWWVRRFAFGPAEWVWRTVTYWKVQPLRR